MQEFSSPSAYFWMLNNRSLTTPIPKHKGKLPSSIFPPIPLFPNPAKTDVKRDN
jgi:hypothetical protein